jgi:hypothetical protein
MARPLMQRGVAQLEELFAKSKTDPKVLSQLEHELQYRQVPRAVALLAEVQEAMHGATAAAASPRAPEAASAAPPSCPAPQPDLWEQAPAAPLAHSAVGGTPAATNPDRQRAQAASDV